MDMMKKKMPNKFMSGKQFEKWVDKERKRKDLSPERKMWLAKYKGAIELSKATPEQILKIMNL